MNVFSYISARKENGIPYNSTFFNHASTSDHRVFHSAFDQASVGYERGFYICSLKILSRTGICRFCIDRPVIIKQTEGGFKIEQGKIRFVIAFQICNGGKEATVGNSADIQFAAFYIDDLGQCVHRGHIMPFFDQVDKQFFFHYISIHEDISVLCISSVFFNRENTFLAVQIQKVTV